MDVEWSSALHPDGTRLSGQVRVELEQPERLDVVSVDPVAVEGRALAVDDAMTVEASLETNVLYRCVRCLTSFHSALATVLHERFSRAPVSPVDADTEVVYVSEPTIHLDPYVEQALVLALLQHPVCRVDCKGLCPVCGADLNIRECGCERKPIDPRLAALAQVLDEMNKDVDSD